MATVKLVVTIDTEEDEWGGYDLPRYRVANITRLTRLQDLFDRFGVRPTYMITQPVAEINAAIEVLAPILERGGCEIGAHCHPWNTPPYAEERTPWNSMLCNLPAELQFQKVAHLKETIRSNYGVATTSFRAGRWGFGPAVAENLSRLGFVVDSSITPLLSWSSFGGPDFDRPYPECYRISVTDLSKSDPHSTLAEVPVTTGFTGLLGWMGYPVHRVLSDPPLRWCRARSIAGRMELFHTTWLCPEVCELRPMIALSGRLIRQGRTILNLMFHSSALTGGLTPFVRSPEDEKRLFNRIHSFLEFCQGAGVESATLTEVSRQALKQ